MDSFERGVLQFVLAWAPYGGPRGDDVWLEFGMTAEELLRRFMTIAARVTAHPGALARSDQCLMHRAGLLLHRYRTEPHILAAETPQQTRAAWCSK